MEFKRIIQNGKFIPEIDGLRFIAISSVVFYHITGFLNEKNKNLYAYYFNSNNTPNFITNGSLGVELFFVISGFILGLFFAKAYLRGNTVNHLSYFKRRLTRLEPPYILVMCVMFLLLVFVLKNLEFSQGLKNLAYSITYTSNLFLGRGNLPILNGVTWSLEVEVQFYILAPILGLLFKIKDTLIRRIIIIVITACCTLFGSLEILHFTSIFDYIEYFLVGFLLADLYVSSEKKQSINNNNNTYIATALGLVVLYIYFQVKVPKTNDSYTVDILYTFTQLTSLFLLFYLVLFQRGLGILKNPIITNIGGACYTIYLLHYPIISAFGNQIIKYQLTQYQLIDNVIYTLILLFFILSISAVFFLLIERPCMKTDWYKNIL
jgi:peptidoglycan/LPS O-acetylase OafA/YrhL